MQVAQELMLGGLQVSLGGVRDVWQRHGLRSKHDRLLRLEKAISERTLALSDEQIRFLERFSPKYRERHIEAPHTGTLVAIHTFFVGVLKGVGKVYLQTATPATPGPGSIRTSCRSPACSWSTTMSGRPSKPREPR